MPKLKRLRTQAFHEQGGRCYYCGLPMWLYTPPSLAAVGGRKYLVSPALHCTAEHLLAKCDGGPDRGDNIAAACEFCNRRRHRRKCAMSAESFRERVRKRMAKGGWHPKPAHASYTRPRAMRESPDPEPHSTPETRSR